MPLYNFDCPVCKYSFDSVVKHGTELTNCPKCKSPAERNHKPTLTTFNLIGNCWSRDGYTTKSQKKQMQKQGTLNKELGLTPSDPTGLVAGVNKFTK